MTVLAADVLRQVPPTSELTAYWGPLGTQQASRSAAAGLALTGDVLPLVRIERRPVHAVVQLHNDAIEQRRDLGLGPVLDRRQIRTFSTGFEPAPPPALTLVAFVSPQPIRRATASLAGLAAWARTVVAVPADRSIDPVEASACDYNGHAVVSTDGEQIHIVVPGDARSDDRRVASTGWRMLREEQLFGLAITTGQVDWP